jgi:alpha-D-xyloside xylohydrolase
MFGPALLVNPVTTPMYDAVGSTPVEGAAKTRSVYLPAGSDWYDFGTGVRCTGGQTIVAAAPLDTIPLYVRAGSILPLAPDLQHSGEVVDAPLDLHVYPGQDGPFTLYEDEGDNYNYEQGMFATISLDWDDGKRKLTIGAWQGSYAGMPASKTFRVIVVGENVAPTPAITYMGQAITIDL